MRPNLGYYVQTINTIVNETEKLGEKMNPSYEKIRKAIDEDKVSSLSSAELKETVELFNEGTVSYHELLEKITKLRPPAKVIGIHKKLEKAYMNYVAGCEEMTKSINPEAGVDIEAFDLSEKKQDESSDTIMFSIEKMTNVLMKK